MMDSTVIYLRTPAAIAAREETLHELEQRFGRKVEHRVPEEPPLPGNKGMVYVRSSPENNVDMGRDLVSAGRSLLEKIFHTRNTAPGEKEKKAGKEGIRMVSGSELRFLILLWRDGETDPEHFDRRDREFIARGEPPGTYSYRELLSGMEHDGLVESSQKEGKLFYRAQCTRLEMLQTLILRYSALADSGERDTVLKSIDIITRCTDLSSGKVVIPESFN
jgi:hypothetical protein